MSLETTNYQCPACGGPVHFVGSTGKVQCDYCDSIYTPEEIEALYAAKQAAADAKAQATANADDKSATDQDRQAAKEDPMGAYFKRSGATEADEENLIQYTCSSCGAQLVSDKTTVMNCCPYCGNQAVVPGQLNGHFRPDYIIPFKLDKQQAVDKLKEHYKRKLLLPKEFADANHIEEVQGVYVPFWLYSAKANGSARFKVEKVTEWTDKAFDYKKTDIYCLHRAGSMEFVRVPADGSTKMPDGHMDAIEPFDYQELKPFSMGYLPGFLAERYDLGAEECRGRVAKRIYQSVIDELKSTTTDFGSASVEGEPVVTTDYTETSCAMLPVWMLHTTWNGQDFLFAMNGQTGKFVGDLPISKAKAAAFGLAAFVICTALMFICLGAV